METLFKDSLRIGESRGDSQEAPSFEIRPFEGIVGVLGTHLLPHVAGHQGALMAAFDLFVLNSSYEGFPHVVLKAMCAGLPVVATAVGGTPKLVRDGENGLLIAPNANGALSKTLMKLVSSSEERQRLAAGALETTQRFQRSVMIEATEAALRACAL
jgi:glycosyltransferase involved in cell wall biosynthesis